MRKTRIHALLTEISNTAKRAKKISNGTTMCEYNSATNRKYMLDVKDRLCELCTKLQDEVFE